MRHELDRDRAQAGTVEHPTPGTLRAARELAELLERHDRQALAAEADARADEEELRRVRRAAAARTDDPLTCAYCAREPDQ